MMCGVRGAVVLTTCVSIVVVLALRKKEDEKRMVLASRVPLITSFSDPAWTARHCDDMNISDTLVLVPRPNKDYWQRTFYKPLLQKDDAPRFTAPVSADAEATLEVSFSLEHKAQFDQAGAFIHVDETHFVKAGIEVVDDIPRLSVVVTNGYSDWSTQPWPVADLRVRIHKLNPGSEQGPAVVVEAFDSEWKMIRIASLRPPQGRPWHLGVFAAAPVAQIGCKATFHSVRLGPKLPTVHDSDPGHS